jgi:hypothetical protein
MNPFQYSDRNPCRENPITILDVRPEFGQAFIDLNASTKEALLEEGEQPAGMQIRRGECQRAAQQLQDPVLRLAFDLMSNGLYEDQEQL